MPMLSHGLGRVSVPQITFLVRAPYCLRKTITRFQSIMERNGLDEVTGTIMDIAAASSSDVVVLSDMHFGSEACPYFDGLVQYVKRNNIKLVVVPGDLTAHGYDGIVRCATLAKCFSCFGRNNKINEVGLLHELFVKPLEDAGCTVLLCPGTHDTFSCHYTPVPDYIRHRYGSLPYKYPFRDTMFYVCGVFPSASICRWLRAELDQRPSVIVFHYTPGINHADWPESDQKQFANSIATNNIKALIVGGTHSSTVGLWKGFLVLNGSSSGLGMGPVAILNLLTWKARLEWNCV
jgi:predicted phosphodiesterase